MFFPRSFRSQWRRRAGVRAIIMLALLGVLAGCSYPPFDQDASVSLTFRRWLEREGELVEEFDLSASEVGSYDDFDSPGIRYVPSMAVDSTGDSPTLALDWGVLAVPRWPDLDLLAIEAGTFERDGGMSRGTSFTRDRFNAWDVRPAIYPGTGESGSIAYYVRTDDSELATDNPGFRFDIGVFTGLHPGGTVASDTTGEPVVGLSDGQAERILAVGLSDGAFAILFTDESEASAEPPVRLRVIESYDLITALGDPPQPFSNAIEVNSSLPLAARALDADRRAVGTVFFEVPAPDTLFSAIGAADPFGVGTGADPGGLSATFPADDNRYRTLVSGIELDDAVIDESVDVQGDRSETRLGGFLSETLVSARENSAFAAYSLDDLTDPRMRRAAGSVHHVISLPDNFAELVDAGEEPSGDESFVGYFTAARRVETAGGSEYIRISVYRVPSGALGNGD